MAFHAFLSMFTVTVVLWQVFSVGEASFILKTKPATIVRGITANVTLRCEDRSSASDLMDNVSTVRILRKLDSAENWRLLADIRDNNNEAISYDQNEKEGILVLGEITPNAKGSFLEIRWPEAKPETFGLYRCDVVGYDENLTILTASTPEHEVTENDVTVKGLLDLLLEERDETDADLKKLKNSTDQIVSQAKNDFTEQIKNIKADIESLKETVEGLRSSYPHYG